MKKIARALFILGLAGALIGWLFILGLAGALIGWMLSAPNPLDPEQIAVLPKGTASAGEQVFWAGGCASCHSAPKVKGNTEEKAGLLLELKTPFGIFRAPNISPHPEFGIGQWDLGDFTNAMKRGVRPDGAHYYPAFPFTSYAKMSDQDVADLWVFMKTLPSSDVEVVDHSLPFPFNIRRGLGLWKLLYLDTQPVLKIENSNPVLERGRYLVEALGHCSECHTPRNVIGGPDKSRWMAGGVGPEGKEKISNITPHKDGIGAWSEADIAYALESGFKPDFDSFSSNMVDVQKNMARLPETDRKAIAAYLKAIRPVPGKP